MKRMIVLGVTIFALAITGCGSSGSHAVKPDAVSTAQSTQATENTPMPSAQTSAPAEAPDDCSQALTTWGDAGATQQFNAVNDDVQQLSSDVSAASGYDATILADADQLESDARAAQADPPPSCSGVTRAYYRAMTD